MLVKVEGGQFVKDTGNKALLTVNRAVLQENEARKKLSGKLNISHLVKFEFEYLPKFLVYQLLVVQSIS